MLGVLKANREQQRVVLEEFQRVIDIRRVSRLNAVKTINSSGALISYQNLKNVRTGVFKYVPNTYLNVISRWCGYNDFVDLVIAVREREQGIKSE